MPSDHGRKEAQEQRYPNSDRRIKNFFGQQSGDRRERQDRRSADRQKKFSVARVMLAEQELSIYATVMNMSPTGAQLKLKYLVKLPEKFEIEVREQDALLPSRFRCKLAWQRNLRFGVSFD